MKKWIILLIFDIASTFGSRIFSFASAFYILQHTDTTFKYSIYLFLIVLVTIISAPMMGVITDSLNNKKLVLFSQLSSIIVLLFFSLLYVEIGLNMIIVTGISLTLVDSIVGLVVQSNLRTIAAEQLERVISLRQTIVSSTTFLAPVIGGFLVAFVSIETLALLTLFTEVIALILLQTLPLKKFIELQTEENFFKKFKDGFVYIKSKRIILTFIASALFVNFFMNSLVVGVPILSIQTLNLKSFQFGLIEASITVSMLLASLYFSIFPIKKKIKSTFKLSVLIQFLIVLALGIFLLFDNTETGSFIFLMLVYLLLGFALTLNNIPYSIYLQTHVDDEYKGRVFSLNQSLVQAIMPLSMLFYGLLLNDNQAFIYILTSFGVLLVLIMFSIMSSRQQSSIKYEMKDNDF